MTDIKPKITISVQKCLKHAKTPNINDVQIFKEKRDILMTHVDYFKQFFQEKTRGTANVICQFIIDNGAHFNCIPGRRYISVNRHISRECGKNYPTGIVYREINSDSVYEYFTR